MKIENVMIINHDEIIKNADVFVSSEKIENIVRKPGVGENILIPGFIDTHIHGFFGEDVMDSQKAVEDISKNLTKFGVTSFVPTIMTQKPEIMINALMNISNSKLKGAKKIGIHSEGPFISIEKKGAHDPKYLMQGNIKFLRKMQEAAKDNLRKITYAPEVGNSEFIREMISEKIVVSIGHSNATASETNIAIELGATSVCHLWNAMTGIENRKPGVVAAVAANKKLYKEIIMDLIHVARDTIKFSIDVAGTDRIMVISDAIRPAGLSDGNYTSGGLNVVKRGNKITLKGTNTIAGGGGSIYTGFKTLVNYFDYNMMDIVKMTSYNAAQSMSKNSIGVIGIGYQADFIIMNKKYKIKKVYVNGEKKYENNNCK